MLYNFLAWSIGFTCDPTTDKKVEISSKEEAKVVSIAEDLIYAESKGKKQTHKSLALGMAVRQMTGLVRLLKILHSLGHIASTDTVSRHNIALAIISSEGDGKDIKIPRNISQNIFATIVWDNNDFSEETLSGKGTTHVANRVLILQIKFLQYIVVFLSRDVLNQFQHRGCNMYPPPPQFLYGFFFFLRLGGRPK